MSIYHIQLKALINDGLKGETGKSKKVKILCMLDLPQIHKAASHFRRKPKHKDRSFFIVYAPCLCCEQWFA